MRVCLCVVCAWDGCVVCAWNGCCMRVECVLYARECVVYAWCVLYARGMGVVFACNGWYMHAECLLYARAMGGTRVGYVLCTHGMRVVCACITCRIARVVLFSEVRVGSRLTQNTDFFSLSPPDERSRAPTTTINNDHIGDDDGGGADERQ